jgi:hypothetical protein
MSKPVKTALWVAGLFFGFIVLFLTWIGITEKDKKHDKSTISTCADVIGNWSGTTDARIQAIERACGTLPMPEQREAARIASERSGVIVYLAPYEAKAARAGAQ